MRRLPFIDSLRGIAAVYVALFHLAYIPSPNLHVPHWASDVVLTGGTAVTMFFLVSAFSLCHAMPAHARQGDGAMVFYTRRLFRIAPLFCVILILYLVRDYWLFSVVHSPKEILENAFYVFNFIPGRQAGIVWASWTIGVEMVFYLIFPLIYANATDPFRVVSLIVLSLFGVVLAHEVLFYTSLDEAQQQAYLHLSIFRHLPIFMFGVGVYYIYDRQINTRRLPASFGVALILGSLYLYYALLHGALNFAFTDSYYWQAIVYGGLILGLGIHPSRVFVNRATQYCGKISYSIYLVHPSVIFFLIPVFRAIYALSIPGTAKFLIAAAVMLVCVVTLASLFYRFVEQPGMRLGKRVIAATKRPVLAAAG